MSTIKSAERNAAHSSESWIHSGHPRMTLARAFCQLDRTASTSPPTQTGCSHLTKSQLTPPSFRAFALGMDNKAAQKPSERCRLMFIRLTCLN